MKYKRCTTYGKLYTAQVIDLGRDYVEFPILQLTLLTYKRATE